MGRECGVEYCTCGATGTSSVNCSEHVSTGTGVKILVNSWISNLESRDTQMRFKSASPSLLSLFYSVIFDEISQCNKANVIHCALSDLGDDLLEKLRHVRELLGTKRVLHALDQMHSGSQSYRFGVRTKELSHALILNVHSKSFAFLGSGFGISQYS